MLRSLIYRAAAGAHVGWRHDWSWPLMAKLKAGWLCREVTGFLPAVLGRHGIHLGEPRVSRAWRDLRLELHRRWRGRDHADVRITCKHITGILPKRPA